MSTFRKIMRNPSAVVGLCILLLLVVVSIAGPFLVESPYEQNTAVKLMPPSAEHWFGTDDFGRDVFSRIVTGAHYSLLAGFISVILGLTGGLLLGAFAGFYGGLLDQILMTVCDILLAFPSVLLAMAIVMVMEPGIYTPMVAVGISSIPVFARLVRAQFMSLRESCFVEAVRSAGAGDLRIIFRHLLPNSIGPIIIQATLRIGSSILLAATLSFLGLGAQPPTPEWGAGVGAAAAQVDRILSGIDPRYSDHHNQSAGERIGDALRDYLDPRTRNM